MRGGKKHRHGKTSKLTCCLAVLLRVFTVVATAIVGSCGRALNAIQLCNYKASMSFLEGKEKDKKKNNIDDEKNQEGRWESFIPSRQLPEYILFQSKGKKIPRTPGGEGHIDTTRYQHFWCQTAPGRYQHEQSLSHCGFSENGNEMLGPSSLGGRGRARRTIRRPPPLKPWSWRETESAQVRTNRRANRTRQTRTSP